MKILMSVTKVELFDAEKRSLGSAEGPEPIRLLLANFATNGAGRVLVCSSPSPKDEKIHLAMSLDGHLQICQEESVFA